MSVSVSISDIEFDVHRVGDRVRLRPRQPVSDVIVLSLIGERLNRAVVAGIGDVIATDCEIMLRTTLTDEMLARRVSTLEVARPAPRELRLPVFFDDTPDWSAVTSETGLPRTACIEQLTSTRLQVAMHGFVPGFAYMAGLPGSLQCQRKTVPDKRTPAGSVAVGGKYLGIYALESPAGWYVLGTTPVLTLDIPQLPPTLLRIGDFIIQDAITKEEFDAIKRRGVDIVTYNNER